MLIFLEFLRLPEFSDCCFLKILDIFQLWFIWTFLPLFLLFLFRILKRFVLDLLALPSLFLNHLYFYIFISFYLCVYSVIFLDLFFSFLVSLQLMCKPSLRFLRSIIFFISSYYILFVFQTQPVIYLFIFVSCSLLYTFISWNVLNIYILYSVYNFNI